MPERDLAAEAAEIAAALGEAEFDVWPNSDGRMVRISGPQYCLTYDGTCPEDAALLRLARRNAELERERDEAVWTREALRNAQAVACAERDEARGQVVRLDLATSEKLAASGLEIGRLWNRLSKLTIERDDLRARVAELEAERDTLRRQFDDLDVMPLTTDKDGLA